MKTQIEKNHAKETKELKEMEEFFNSCNESQYDGEILPLDFFEEDE